MKQINALFILAFGLFGSAQAQQHFSNGGFENYTSCPTGWDQTNKIIGRTGQNDTPEYYNCSYSPGAANNGTGSVYLGAIRNGNSLTQEGINLILDTPLSAGTTYTISLAVNYRVTVYSDPGFDYSQYRGCFGLRFAFGNGNQSGRPTTYQYELDGDATYGNANNGYNTVSFTFTPTQSYTHLYIITAAMDGNVSTITNPDCTSSGSVAYVYYHLIDDLSITPSGGLPVELSYFTAVRSENQVDLNWQTLSERNSDYFTVEKSTDAIVWSTLGEVQSAGESQEPLDYILTDESPSSKITYYRLIQQDFDGVKKVIATSSVNAADEIQVQLYPNPSSETIYLKGEVENLENYLIVDVRGSDVSQSVQLIENQKTQIALNVEGLESGVYFVHAGNETIRFVKD